MVKRNKSHNKGATCASNLCKKNWLDSVSYKTK